MYAFLFALVFSIFKKISARHWWLMAVILAIGRLRLRGSSQLQASPGKKVCKTSISTENKTGPVGVHMSSQ
jgi:hypothetical protein